MRRHKVNKKRDAKKRRHYENFVHKKNRSLSRGGRRE